MALNQLKFDQLETGSVYPITASYALNSSGGGGGTTLTTGSTYPITASWSNNATTASFASNSTSASYSNTASVALNSLTASYLNPISQSLIPSTGSIYSLGSPTNKWKDLYVSTGSIYIGETVLSTSGSTLFANSSPIVTLNTASGQIEVAGLTASLSASYSSTASILVTPELDNVYLVVQNGIMKWIPIATVAVSFLSSIFYETEYIYQPSLTILPSVSFLDPFFSENEYIYETPLTLLASVSFVSSFTSGSI